ncbi:MAG: zinc ribbon domain-containing protein [Pseudomonadota bacterium]
MPIYEYACSSCGFEKDYLQKMSDPLLTDCPQCGKATLYKKLSAPGFQLKGSGWYATDFKGGSTSAAPASQNDATAPAASTATESSTSTTTSETTSSHSCGTGACGKCA